MRENDEYLKALPPLEFEYRYMPVMPKGQVDKKAVLGAAYEEMGQTKEMSVEEMDHRFAPDENFTSRALDINKDGKLISQNTAQVSLQQICLANQVLLIRQILMEQ